MFIQRDTGCSLPRNGHESHHLKSLLPCATVEKKKQNKNRYIKLQPYAFAIQLMVMYSISLYLHLEWTKKNKEKNRRETKAVLAHYVVVFFFANGCSSCAHMFSNFRSIWKH